MTDCHRRRLTYSSRGPKAVVAGSQGGRLPSGAAALLLRETGEKTCPAAKPGRMILIESREGQVESVH
jgi:hypothetical protein